uniref:Uncharacterized protein n=1 Tax=Rhizophora mucronata TaxID=61149 RepID=A0A2P2QJT7_RHIMU
MKPQERGMQRNIQYSIKPKLNLRRDLPARKFKIWEKQYLNAMGQ